jgi:Uncharacterized small protein (DUF2292)
VVIVSKKWPAPDMNANNTAENRYALGRISNGLLPELGRCSAPTGEPFASGVVEITVHESQVVQVERTEKARFAQAVSQKPNS